MKGILLGSRKHGIKIQENLGRFEEAEIEGGFGKKGWRAEKCVCGCDVAINTSRDIFFSYGHGRRVWSCMSKDKGWRMEME